MNSQADFVRALFDPGSALPNGLTSWNGSDPAPRFAVYQNNVVLSLIDALADTFPVVQALVGEEFFRAMAKVFVQSSPPRSRLMADYGCAFPDFVADFPPAAGLAYLPDVARLEIARVQAYHAADVSAIEPDQLMDVATNASQLMALGLDLHPSVQVVASSHAICSLWAAHQGLVEWTEVDTAVPQNVLVFRRALDVEVIELRIGSATFVSALQGGRSLLEAACLAEADDQGFDLADTLAFLIQRQLITDISTEACSHEQTH